MILDIDAGNSFVKWRLTGQDGTVTRGSQPTNVVLTQGLDLAGVNRLSMVRLSSVANKALAQQLQKQLFDQFAITLQVARVSVAVSEVTCGYLEPEKLGIDRWLAVVAAYQAYRTSVLVIDAGSAMTLDLVSADGHHVGGYILAGSQMMREGLAQGTDAVKVDALDPINVMIPGKNTPDAVNRGCLLTAVAVIEKLAAQYPAALVITGGDAPQLIEALSLDSFHRPDLVLEGLAVDGVEFTQVSAH